MREEFLFIEIRVIVLRTSRTCDAGDANPLHHNHNLGPLVSSSLGGDVTVSDF